MGFAFLTPAFLIGLAALAVPIIIHLTHRERREVVPFPSLMFLHKIPYRSVRRQKIRHWLLFLLRCLGLVLLAAAFARPWFDRLPAQAGLAGGGARELVILVDQSYSMGYRDRWSKALDAARRAVGGLRDGDRATLVFFSDRARVAVGPTAEPGALRTALEAARLSTGVTRYAPALRLAGQLLEESELPRREVLLITDFQKAGWEPREVVRLPRGSTLSYVDLSDRKSSNVTVTAVDFAREYSAGRERLTATARLTNKGDEPFANFDVALDVNGRTLETKPVDLEPNSAATVTFEPFVLPDGLVRGTVRSARDALQVDNVFHFVLSRAQTLSVLVLEAPDAGAAKSLYLTRALRIGHRPPFRVDVKKIDRLVAADLKDRSLVILNDVGFPGGYVGRRLADFVRAGGGLLLALGERSNPRSWPADAVDLLPAPFGAPTDRSADRGGTLAFLDRSHPVFELFNAPRSGDWASARFFRYRPLQVEGREGVLARFDDGAVALMEKKIGRGKALVWTSTLDNLWNNLPVQPVFLPFIHQLAKYAATYTEDQPWFVAGQVVDVPRYVAAAESAVRREAGASAGRNSDTAGGSGFVAVAPSGERTRFPAAGRSRALELVEQGFYEVRPLGDRDAHGYSLAVNLDLAESDLAPLDPEELVVSVASRQADTGEVAAAGALTAEERERRQTLWWYLLTTAFLVLAAETVLSNRLSRAARRATMPEQLPEIQRPARGVVGMRSGV